ncbi:beta-N-acetylhexosaminidase [Novosphingopyxis sp. YJ-S2-01]|uniref:beta-N-acetylhexosaminidase n=1 Tax=Novosphingopyxis sp. YJ-S2-01 TaxID=2794021 RepID=UPI0018DE9DEC|nr:beta-N-acetylhexosaminidase [Novosphingopyxis sp. YJ-S2-01]MBH9537599.1 beta-N-acetylhexosaminidase [Novosphingopyxis sp. YJ-S2-01]
MLAAIFGLSGLELTDAERGFFLEADPAGYILFGRNFESKDQVRALTDGLRALHGRDDVPIMVDQEGGRVQRMKPPVWPQFPAGARFAELYRLAPISAMQAALLNAEAIGVSLAEVGINVDCLPLLDVRAPGAHDVIGDRALGEEPMQVAALGRAVLDGLAAAGVGGIVKHIPGHGRAMADSHKSLPVVDASADELERDIAPFAALSHATMAMTAHIVFTAWDEDRPATLSPTVIEDIIRGKIGFDGLLFSDDLDMEALDGSVPERAEAAVAAGCDIALNCWAKMDDMTGIAQRLGTMKPQTKRRYEAACAALSDPGGQGRLDELVAKRDELLALV